jgi:imidazolonepropionase
MPSWDSLWRNGRLATLDGGAKRCGVIEHGALAVSNGRIAWLGPEAALPEHIARETHDLGGALVTPGLIDCHTHLVFAGERSREFEQRLEGRTYAEISAAGGGIRSTVAATRRASEAELYELAFVRLGRLQASGATTVEIKSGYGLDIESETKALRVARRLGRRGDCDVVTTFLGAHALPPEYADDRAAFVGLVAGPMLDAVVGEGLVDAVDAFGEHVAFTPDEVRQVFEAASRRGLPVKLHADQLSDSGGAALAASFGALSADHVEYTSEAGVEAMARSGTIAVLLPGAFYCLRETRRPPVELFRKHGVPMAVATDANPGTSPVLSLPLAMNMVCTLFGLTVAEALAGATRNAARALGLTDRGTLEIGKRADLAVWQAQEPAELCYWLGADLLRCLVKDGRIVRTT